MQSSRSRFQKALTPLIVISGHIEHEMMSSQLICPQSLGLLALRAKTGWIAVSAGFEGSLAPSYVHAVWHCINRYHMTHMHISW